VYLTGQSKWKKIKPTWAILLANSFHIHYLFWTKSISQIWGNFVGLTWIFSTLTFIDPFSHTFFPNTITGAAFGSFVYFQTDIHKVYLLWGVCLYHIDHSHEVIHSRHTCYRLCLHHIDHSRNGLCNVISKGVGIVLSLCHFRIVHINFKQQL